MSKFQDIASMEIEDEAEKLSEPRERVPEGNAKQSEKKFLKFEDGEVVRVTDYVKNLSFNEKFKLLFGKDIEEDSDSPKESPQKNTFTDKLNSSVKIVLGIAIIAVVLQLAIGGIQRSEANKNQNLQNNLTKDEAISQAIPGVTMESVSRSVEREISLYNNEEVKKIEDYLSMRGNRGATMTSIRMQRAKKENTYISLSQYRYIFEDGETPEEIEENMKLYTQLEEKIIQSIVLSEEALAAFDDRSTSTVLKYLIPRYHRV